jgi:hypothetical protein
MAVSFILIDRSGAGSRSAMQVVESNRVPSGGPKAALPWPLIAEEDLMETGNADLGKMEAELRQWRARLENAWHELATAFARLAS